MLTLDVIQGSQEWLRARAGSLGASQIADALAKTKSGWGASRANVRARIVAERLTGEPQDTFCSPAMQWGKDTEARARAAYEFKHDAEVTEVGMVLHPTIDGTHASPDGLVNADGLLEIKCPNTATHIDTLRGGPIAQKYILQMQWQMHLCGREWCDFASFDPRLPLEMQLYVQRVERDPALIDEIETEVRKFLDEVNEAVAELTARYLEKEAA